MSWLKVNKYGKILIVIVLIGIALRFYLLGTNPPSLTWDEASIGYNAYSVLKTGNDEYGNFLPLSFRSFDDYKPPVYFYLTVPTVAIFGLTELAVRLPAAIFGVLSIIVCYFLVKVLFVNFGKKSEYYALLSSFFLAVSPWHLQFSRAAFEGNIGMFFLILSLLLFFMAFKKPVYFLFFAIAFLLSMYSYHSFRLINPIIFIGLIVLFYRQIIVAKTFFIIASIFIILFSIPIYSSFLIPSGTGARLSMVTIFEDSKTLEISAQKSLEAANSNDLIGKIIYNRRVIFIPQIIKGYLDHFNFDFLFLRGDGGVQHHAYNMGMLYLWDFPFMLLGVIFLLKKFDRRILLLFLIFFLGPLPASFTTGTPQPIRAIGMIPAFHIFAASGYMYCFYLFKRRQIGRYLLTSLALLFFVNMIYYFHSYFVLSPIKYGYFWQYGNKQAVLYAKSREDKFDRIIMSYEYDQPYIYYLFYNKIDPSWYQKNWNYSKNGSVDRFYRKIGKYEFKTIDFTKDSSLTNSLIIGTPREIPISTDNNILFPDGKIAYKILEKYEK